MVFRMILQPCLADCLGMGIRDRLIFRPLSLSYKSIIPYIPAFEAGVWNPHILFLLCAGSLLVSPNRGPREKLEDRRRGWGRASFCLLQLLSMPSRNQPSSPACACARAHSNVQTLPQPRRTPQRGPGRILPRRAAVPSGRALPSSKPRKERSSQAAPPPRQSESQLPAPTS